MPADDISSQPAQRTPGWRAALDAANAARRCGAKTRTARGGAPCRNPAMANGRCRMHGGGSTGPRTTAGREWCRRANLRHGARSAEFVALRKEAMAVRRELVRLTALVNDMCAEESRVWRPSGRKMGAAGPGQEREARSEWTRGVTAEGGAPPKVTMDPMHPELPANNAPRSRGRPRGIALPATGPLDSLAHLQNRKTREREDA